MPSASSSSSCFDRIFDILVCGSGMIGLSAARALAARGRTVLLVNSSGDLLWETSLALENRADSSPGPDAWSEWLQRLESFRGTRAGFFDGALAETLAAHDLVKTPGLSTLLYAMPVAVEQTHGLLTALTVATKSGPRRLRAHQWVDATERGLLAQHVLPSASSFTREPSSAYRSLVLQSIAWDQPGATLPALPSAEWLLSVRDTERRLRWLPPAGTTWHDDVIAILRRLRESLSIPFIVSHASQCDYPVYAAAPSTAFRPPSSAISHPSSALPLPANLLVLSPALTRQPLASISERVLLGTSAPARLAAMPSHTAAIATAAPVLPSPAETLDSTVLVAGSGTAGALAALASARQNTDTLAIDSTRFPGGIGTDGGINKYCAGLPGGLQTRLDDLSSEFSLLLSGSGTFGAVWHHLGKRLAILTLFAEARVRYQGETLLCGVEKTPGDRIESVLVAVDGRIVRLRARAFIDSTGDGDLCALAGADFTLGRADDGICLAYSQAAYALKQVTDGVTITFRNYDAGWVDPTDPEDLSRARLRGLAQYLRPDWTDSARPFALASTLGLRQSRQIITEKAVTFDDLVAGARFPDSIGGARTFADTHAVDFEFESDDSLFYYWVCQSFRHPLQCELPYRMLIPKGLTNVWIACRAAGLEISASYGIRMQRDMQRLGEAAGTAAALVARTSGESRSVDLPALQSLLRESGACLASSPEKQPAPAELQALLETGRADIHLWHVYRQPDAFRPAVERLLSSLNPTVSFQAASILAMWNSPKGETRLLGAIEAREQGPEPDCGKGAFAQDVDIPYWLLAVVLLRRCGTARCLPLLHALAVENLPFNVRTCIALTLERLARPEDSAQVFEIQEWLMTNLAEVANLPPTRSLRRMLEGKPQLVLGNYTGADTREDQSWQLHLVIARTRARLGLPIQTEVANLRQDPRSYVRRAFQGVQPFTKPGRTPAPVTV